MGNAASRLAICAALFALSSPAHAEDEAAPTVILPFIGPKAQVKAAELTVYKALKKRAYLLPVKDWDAAAKRNFATSLTADDISVTAREIGAKIVITGSIKREGRLTTLHVSVRSGETGKSVDKLRYVLRKGRITPKTLAELAKEVNEGFDKALGDSAEGNESEDKPLKRGPGQPPVAAARPGAGRTRGKKPPEPPKPEEAPVVAPPPPPPPLETGRPKYAPYIDAEVGFFITSRRFVFNDGTRAFGNGAGAGIHVDATVFPFAFSYKKLHGVFAGLGFGVLLDAPFWPGSLDKLSTGMLLTYPTTELRAEGGLRWWFTLSKKKPLPQLLFALGGGGHSFSIDSKANTMYSGPPSINYTYVSIGLGFRLQPVRWFRLAVANDVHIGLGVGPLASAAEYGPTSLIIAFRPALKLDFFVWRGLRLGLGGFYERYLIRLAENGMGDRRIGGIPSTAVDQYFGGSVYVGYQF